MFTDTWHFLNQEAYLIGACLGNGLTALRRASRKGKGEWYAAFFQLSIGLERLMKAIIVVDHVNRDRMSDLTTDTLKNKYGHDLGKLLDHVGQVSVETKPNPASLVDRTGTGFQILEFLNKFAKDTRYHNLNKLTGRRSDKDPLAEWGAILNKIIQEDVPEKRRTMLLAEGQLMAEIVQLSSFVVAHDLDQSALTAEAFLRQPQMHDEAAGYAICHLLNVARPLEAVLKDLTDASKRPEIQRQASVPDMWEHMYFLRMDKCGEIRRRKTWGVEAGG